uniref:uncharacterized protein LOC124051897 n=1 Tax=Scatophagus argus TaxID=75038 RepID=UPI001ED8097F|nr:uncharacterized protein LOC124051897 [Scatophagus argus]
MGGVRAPTAADVCVSRLEPLKLEWTRGNLDRRTVFSSSSLIILQKTVSPRSLQPGAVHSHLERFHSRHPALVKRRVRLNGSCPAHLSAVRDDRARAGLRLDAIPQTERQASQTRCWTSAALKCPGVSGCLEGKQSAGQDRQRREGPEEERTHREKSLMKGEARCGWTCKKKDFDLIPKWLLSVNLLSAGLIQFTSLFVLIAYLGI